MIMLHVKLKSTNHYKYNFGALFHLSKEPGQSTKDHKIFVVLQIASLLLDLASKIQEIWHSSGNLLLQTLHHSKSPPYLLYQIHRSLFYCHFLMHQLSSNWVCISSRSICLWLVFHFLQCHPLKFKFGWCNSSNCYTSRLKYGFKTAQCSFRKLILS